MKLPESPYFRRGLAASMALAGVLATAACNNGEPSDAEQRRGLDVSARYAHDFVQKRHYENARCLQYDNISGTFSPYNTSANAEQPPALKYDPATDVLSVDPVSGDTLYLTNTRQVDTPLSAANENSLKILNTYHCKSGPLKVVPSVAHIPASPTAIPRIR